MPSLKDQLAALAAKQPLPQGKPRGSVVRDVPPPALAKPRRVGDTYSRLPRRGVDAESQPTTVMGDIASMTARLAFVEAASANIASQLAVGPNDPTVDAADWRRRAERAKLGFEQEATALESAIRRVRDVQGGDSTDRATRAEEQCRALAAEVERLTAELDARGPAGRSDFHAAFMEVARIVLSEVTFQRIHARAEEFAKTRKTDR